MSIKQNEGKAAAFLTENSASMRADIGFYPKKLPLVRCCDVWPNPTPADLVFLGGGHAHVAAIKSFAMNPIPGLRLTIVTSDIHTTYSGMLPGYIEGVWQDEDIHIDLRISLNLRGQG